MEWDKMTNADIRAKMISMKEIADGLVEQQMQGTQNVDCSQEI